MIQCFRASGCQIWEFPKKNGVPYFGSPIIRILLVRILNKGPLLSETPILKELDFRVAGQHSVL